MPCAVNESNDPEGGGGAADIVEERTELPPAARLVLAGLTLEQGLADKKVAKRWRQTVLDGKFRATDCAQEILETARPDPTQRMVLDRASRLLRDFLMAPMQRGLRGAARRGRERARSGCAYVVAQATAFTVFAVIACAIGILLRMKGNSLDGWADWVLDLFGAAP